ncbi:MAG: copper-binding protein [Gammaproteobacteria bacterium]|nr:copper-binding protein [Gammaproteobacteria bacterium]
MKSSVRVLMLCVLASTSFASPEHVVQPAGVTHVIEITGFKFLPKNVDAQPGDTITWVNRDIAPHTASSKDGSWDTGTLAQNESKSIVVAVGMASAYFCKFHPGMTATITTKNE